MTREQILRLGFELPEGRNIGYLIEVKDRSKPPIEVEIYRPVIPDNQLTVSDLALAPFVQHMGFAEEIAEHSGDQQCFDFIKEKVGTCIKQHKCGKDGGLPVLPDRVIWIEANNASRIQLLEPKNICAPFIALSYCWGPVGPNTYLTNARNLEARKASIEFNDLPPLFQNVVDVARSLGIEYIWIDRLCIIQGDDEDFHSQAAKMGEIYGNATLTIAAASATTENDRILVPRDEKWWPFDLNLDFDGIGSLNLRFRRRSHALDTEASGGDYGKMSTRAWIWQERLLAARTLFFTPTALRFECRCHSFWEGFCKGRTGLSWSAQLDNITHVAWTRLVEEYMGRDITRPYDRLPAMGAVMKRIEKSTGWSPFWGLWTNAVAESLVWKARASGSRNCRMNPGHYAPTWSWASVDGPISYTSARPRGEFDKKDPIQWDLEYRGLNEISGLIRISGYMILVELDGIIERNESHGNSPTEEEKFQYKYKIKCENDQGYAVTPDVALKP
ncbi:uncharacterized protein A1O5_13358 [Cladophialophora psammophila CBS 110553]|uniref:Heterokaryon incompatibility domain-containing protein n=1 Tax=Cladophialophora psammophila CBS 110553 TaxID=1182543 RepID=W9W4B7_9EURO|nr:uncharacterized protein A1O5_13358 [Cladophialophora psammophila CBS 110553]EXJ53424.1 hypothetical protein A1O5_13358 [Cladophialophora psammophila CBS 110553]